MTNTGTFNANPIADTAGMGIPVGEVTYDHDSEVTLIRIKGTMYIKGVDENET